MGYTTEYKEANRDRIAASEKEYRERNKEKRLQQIAHRYEVEHGKIMEEQKRYRENNNDKIKSNKRKHREENPEIYAIRSIKRLYKVTEEQAVDLYKRSFGSCDSCGIDWNADKNPYRFCVDHNHTTGEVRGILCHECNMALGLLKESSEKISRLHAYNERYNGN